MADGDQQAVECGISPEYLNVGRVLKLLDKNLAAHHHTGLAPLCVYRLSPFTFGLAWLVIVASEMLPALPASAGFCGRIQQPGLFPHSSFDHHHLFDRFRLGPVDGGSRKKIQNRVRTGMAFLEIRGVNKSFNVKGKPDRQALCRCCATSISLLKNGSLSVSSVVRARGKPRSYR